MKTAPILLALSLAVLTSCDEFGTPSADKAQAAATETLTAEAQHQVGMPNITNFTERKFAKMILELCDTEGLRTFTYIVDLNGGLHLLTESIGYGLPYSTQFTNPLRAVEIRTAGQGANPAVTVPQPDPNGLFKPEGLSATWILASTPDGVVPLYVEPQIIVSPFRLVPLESEGQTEPK